MQKASWMEWAGVLGAVGLAWAGLMVPRERWRELAGQASEVLDWRYDWHRLAPYPAASVLAGLRAVLREKNLADTSRLPKPERDEAAPPPPPDYLQARSPDGTYNDLREPRMGSARTRFGRNVPNERTWPEGDDALLRPNPRTVSHRLLTRDPFLPATTVNLLAGAWLQFMVHDWFSHGRNVKENPWQVPVEDQQWPGDRPLTILRTRPDGTRTDQGREGPPTFINTETHWWDGSQLYGSQADRQAAVRAGENGKLKIGSDGLLLVDEKGFDVTGLVGNWWIGLSILHTLFTLEHNAVCDRLRREYPGWSDDRLFEKARLITAALLAKIHTVEWTPAILGHPAIRIGLRANWWGVAEERVHRLVGRLSSSELISGIPGSPTDHHGVPYSVTEEFVAVYRMHPLLPDDLFFYSLASDERIDGQKDRLPFHEVAHGKAHAALERFGMVDSLYSFGTMHPGQITLRNFPRSLQEFVDENGIRQDLAATDILRIRERGVPRYNEFRELFHRPRLTAFEQLSDKPELVEAIREVYENDLDRVDLMIGLYAEPLPAGFAFSDTAFRVFILMASRRLKSDRFFTADFTPEVYTPTGLEWIANNTMSTVLLRHFPQLFPALRGRPSAFHPWNRGSSGQSHSCQHCMR